MLSNEILQPKVDVLSQYNLLLILLNSWIFYNYIYNKVFYLVGILQYLFASFK